MRGEVHILVYCPIDTLQWGQTHSAMGLIRPVFETSCLAYPIQVVEEIQDYGDPRNVMTLTKVKSYNDPFPTLLD